MTSGDWISLAVALAAAVLAGLFAAVEAALRAIPRSRAEEAVAEGLRGTKRLLEFTEDPPPYLNTALFLRLVCEIVAIVLVTLVTVHHVGQTWLELLIVIGGMSLLSFVAWGVAPRTLGRQHALGIGRAGLGWLSPLTALFGPITQGLIFLGNALTPGRGYADGPWASEGQIRELVDMAEASDRIEADERRMIHSVFEFGDTIVREVMVPRTDMVIIEETKTLRQAVSLALRSGFSRIPVVREGADDVVGILYLKDVIRRVYDNQTSQSTELVSSIMRPVSWCPDSKPIDELLQDMQRTRTHLVMVVDEFGGTAGLVTIEDILEEIVGEIVDEYDNEIPPVQKLADDRYRVLSRLPIDELGELFAMRLDDEDVETVGGLMAKELNMVPIAGSVVHWEGLELTAERSVGRRNNQRTVLVTRATDVDPAEAATQLAVESANRAS